MPAAAFAASSSFASSASAPAASASSFVAVGSGTPGGDADLTPGFDAEHTSARLRCRAQALATLAGAAFVLGPAALGAALLLAGWQWFVVADLASAAGGVGAFGGAALLALIGGAWLGGASPRRRPSRVAARTSPAAARPPADASRVTTESHAAPAPERFARQAAIAAPLALMAAAPWLVRPGVDSGGVALLAGLMVALALLATTLLAANRALALGAAALPLSSALQAGLTAHPAGPIALGPTALGPTALGPTLALAGLSASLALALLAVVLHRRWRDAALASIDLEDRVTVLEAARDAAVRADQEKSRFLAIASHDLRQPVHAIGLFAATLEKRLAGSAEEPLVRNLNRAIDGLDRSFNVMLDISRLDAGAVEPRVRQFPLRDLFRRLHMHFAGQAEQLGLSLRFSPGGKSVSSDPQLLERVLGNLVQNAIKYTERGGVVVVARSTASHTHVEIWDTGVGIRAADLPKIFDEFYQVGRGERVRAQGLGMGLAIVKRLVRLMGHRLTVSSRPGRGTMFRLAIARGELPYIQEVTAAADTLPMPVLQARTVLVLDDEEPIREGLCLLLQEWGYDALAAGSIAEAEAAVEQLDAPPDLMLSDLHLGENSGGRDGIHAIELIRRRCGVNVAAMLITGDTSHTEIRRATESGHPVLFKPVQPRKLYDALRGLGS